MKCPSCGRIMVNMLTFLKCSNRLCDYEEDIEPWQISAIFAQDQSSADAFKPITAWTRIQKALTTDRRRPCPLVKEIGTK
jgi:hypothetical protein